MHIRDEMCTQNFGQKGQTTWECCAQVEDNNKMDL
jgi:hypothetical protein